MIYLSGTDFPRRRRRDTQGRSQSSRNALFRSELRGLTNYPELRDDLGAEEPRFVSPGDAISYRDQVDAQIRQTLKEAVPAYTNGQIPSKTWTAFKAFIAEWDKSQPGWGSAVFSSASAWAFVRGYQERLVQWQSKLEANGAMLTSPKPDIPKDTPKTPSILKWAVGGAIAVGVIAVVPKLLEFIPKARAARATT